ncbi:SDR family NAD(P)-dependent oxidoreductase [Rhodococcus globerulus]|uniref:SDR family NAD(P)-dependent oxidoreductase n=1 Tax=Rhodococcus globerulus TaxID=33008 RepID=A0ABU4C598_RHOGO|nr:SDR family NAD(P)-dependent oxidoreductase [Rhodococcus globerulus]MDV6271449.1 SDR family NAD(P)-dependent oxidoreductase [Rhodococcus globerulus]
MNRLKDRVALVTGGASGLGAETCLLFAEQGADIVVADLNDERGAEVVRGVEARGRKAVFHHTDVAKSDDLEAAVRLAEETFGKLDTVVANAGIGGAASRKRLEDLSEEQMDEVIQVNMSGVWRTFKFAAPALRRAGGGSMTSSASVAGQTILGGSTLGGYTASKFGAVGLTKFFAAELAADGIRVNCVCPGRMQTNIDESYHWSAEELEEARRRRQGAVNTVMRTMAEPREVAYLHLFLCSDEASFITGQSIEADGGLNLFMNKAGLVTETPLDQA